MTRPRAAVGLAIAQVRHARGRTVLAIVGVALAVVATTTLAGVGLGVLETGEAAFDRADRDLWVTGDSVGIAPASVGGVDPPVTDAHEVAAEIERREDVRSAAPLGFGTLYVGSEPGDYDRIVGVGVPGDGSLTYREGDGFERPDTHYAGGSYDGPRVREVVVDGATARRYDVSVGDTLHVGGTTAGAARNEYTVVGVSDTIADLTGTATVTIYLSELQELTGRTGTDEATFVTVTLADGADAEAVQRDLEAAYPQYEVRTDREQFRAILGEQVLVLAGAGTLVALAVVAGVALVVTVLALTISGQRRQLAALRAIGVSTPTIAGAIATQALVYAAAGGLLGALASPIAGRALDRIAERVTGFEGLVTLPPAVLVLAVPVAALIGVVGAGYVAWRIGRIRPLRALDE